MKINLFIVLSLLFSVTFLLLSGCDIISTSASPVTAVKTTTSIVAATLPVFSLTVRNETPQGGTIMKSSSPDPLGFHRGDLVMLTATPLEGYIFGGWKLAGAVVDDANDTTIDFAMPENDVTVTAVFIENKAEHFFGEFETVMGSYGTSNGCEWDQYIGGSIDLALFPGTGEELKGTVEFNIDIWTVTTSKASDTNCSTFTFSYVISGDITGMPSNFSGDYHDDSIRPLYISVEASRNGDEVEFFLVFRKTFTTYVNGQTESYPELSTSLTVKLEKVE